MANRSSSVEYRRWEDPLKNPLQCAGLFLSYSRKFIDGEAPSVALGEGVKGVEDVDLSSREKRRCVGEEVHTVEADSETPGGGGLFPLEASGDRTDGFEVIFALAIRIVFDSELGVVSHK